MIISFKDDGTRDIFLGQNTRAARKTCPQLLWPAAQEKLDQLARAKLLGDMNAPPGNQLERLKGDRMGQYSVRINRRYRVCFWWTEDGPAEVEIVDYH